jgi:hypothetical protein
MCPLCLSALAWIAAGGVSTAGLAALLVKRREEGDDDGDDHHDPSGREP